MTYHNYNAFINYLKSLQDLKYKEFHSKLTFTKYEIIGIRVPLLRKIAKEIINSNYNSKCLYESTNNNCYNNFSNYIVTLKKASDRKYYFYSIKKEKN